MATPLSSQVSIPTLEKLNVKLPEDIDARQVAATWLQAFSKATSSSDVEGVVALVLEDGLWRDMLALTWDFRTLHGASRIHKFLNARLAESKITAIRLAEDGARAPTLFTAIPGVVWVQGLFDFETAVGVGSGVFRIVPAPNGQWKAHVIYTNLESLHGVPSKVGPLRNPKPYHGQWLQRRAEEVAFEDAEPRVLIIGSGQSGLDVAARLKYSDVPSLVVERNPRVGDSWRNRYEALCLHDPVWYDHMPYMSFPPTWPVHTPAVKLADWMESYARTLDLNIWTSTLAESVERDEAKDEWVVRLKKSDGSTRIMRPKHVVLAFGLGGNELNIPEYPGMNEFKGEMLHFTAHKTAKNFVGKKAVVIGACTSGHDICHDFQRHGVDVTMIQRSSTCVISIDKAAPILVGGLYAEDGPPVDVADRLSASFPIHLMKLLHTIQMKYQVSECDKETIEGLERVGFKTNTGVDGSGPMYLAYKRAGGFYLDTGASQLIIDGKIKVKNGSVKGFSKDGLLFEDGSALQADVVVFANGFGDARVPVRKLIGDKLGENLKPIWGLTDEGEMSNLWGDSGLPNFYFMLGNLAFCRFYSNHVALQIQAAEKGLPLNRYKD